MRKQFTLSLLTSIAAIGFTVCPHAQGRSAELDEAVTLVKQMHVDQCHQHQLRGKLLLAHQTHDQDTMDDLYAQLDKLNQRLKPVEDKLRVLKTSIRQKPEDQREFESTLLQNGTCED
jgi:hypothetical protein